MSDGSQVVLETCVGQGFTHKQLVERAVRWLRGTRKCALVVAERNVWSCSESPDAIGWLPRGQSILVECKTSVSDFYADRAKPSRRELEIGLGRERWYLTEPGLLTGRTLPAGWGLLEIHHDRIRRIVHAQPFVDDRIARNEVPFLVSIARRGAGATGVTIGDEDVNDGASEPLTDRDDS